MASLRLLNCGVWRTLFRSARTGTKIKVADPPPGVKVPPRCVSGIVCRWCGIGEKKEKNVDGRQRRGPASAGLSDQAAARTRAGVGRSDRALWLALNGLAGSCWKPCPTVSFPWPFWKRHFLCLAQEFFSPARCESGVAGPAGQWWLCSIVAF